MKRTPNKLVRILSEASEPQGFITANGVDLGTVDCLDLSKLTEEDRANIKNRLTLIEEDPGYESDGQDLMWAAAAFLKKHPTATMEIGDWYVGIQTEIVGEFAEYHEFVDTQYQDEYDGPLTPEERDEAIAQGYYSEWQHSANSLCPLPAWGSSKVYTYRELPGKCSVGWHFE